MSLVTLFLLSFSQPDRIVMAGAATAILDQEDSLRMEDMSLNGGTERLKSVSLMTPQNLHASIGPLVLDPSV